MQRRLNAGSTAACCAAEKSGSFTIANRFRARTIAWNLGPPRFGGAACIPFFKVLLRPSPYHFQSGP